VNADWWTSWLTYNGPYLLITLVSVIWVGRLWRRQFNRSDLAMAIQHENTELLRQMLARLTEIRDISKGKP
jgi:hypothetical protein